MRTAFRAKAKHREELSQVRSLPSPIGGWNARDALALMPPTDAVILDNFMPKASYCELRGGFVSHVSGVAVDLLTEGGTDLTTESGDFLATEDVATAIGGTIKTLAVYNGLNGLNKLFAITEQGVYDVSTAGPVGPILIARTDGKHQWTMFGDGTSNWLIAANGIDKILYYDGTTWTAVDGGTSPALTNLDTTRIIGMMAHQGRLFFLEKGSLSFWYLPPAVAGGALTEFDLSSQAKRGGYLVAMGSWTRDAGDGQDDVAVFVTSEGEAIIYQGDNPSQANAWNKIGSFYVGRPLGRRCLTQLGGDLIILTENGAFPLSVALQSAILSYTSALSNKIEKAFTEIARTTGSVFGWEAIIYQGQQALIVNVPIAEDGLHYQYVMNTLTKAWCRFTGWDAETFALFNKELYFARGSSVYKAWVGAIDGTDNIISYGKQAFSYFGSTSIKFFKMMRPILNVNGNITYQASIDVDFEDTPILNTSSSAGVSGAIWDVSQWDNCFWAGELVPVKQWTTIAKFPGFCAAPKLQISTNFLSVQWMSTDVMFEKGAVY